MSDEAKKFDAGKPRIDLVEPDYILGTASVMTFGMDKYGKENWKNGMEVGRIYAAALRHLLAFQKGEITDPESGLSHLYHASSNLMMLNWYVSRIKQ